MDYKVKASILREGKEAFKGFLCKSNMPLGQADEATRTMMELHKTVRMKIVVMEYYLPGIGFRVQGHGHLESGCGLGSQVPVDGSRG
jgi:hypothetical protein